MKRLAIVAVAYNRTTTLRRLLTSLEQADYPEEVTLIISIDKSDTDAVEQMAAGYHWPHGELQVVRHKENLGLRCHMLSLAEHFAAFDALIVLEDDVTVQQSFYLYSKACVEKYYGDEHIAGISLYSYTFNYQTSLPFQPAWAGQDVFLMSCAMSWGQVWMKPQWEAFSQWYGENSGDFCLPHLPSSINHWPKSSWLKYHIRYCIEQDKYFVYPYFSLSTNNADPGINFDRTDNIYQSVLAHALIRDFRLPASGDIEVRYDGFFQPKFLGRHIGVEEEDLCVNLFSEKPECLRRRYVLTDKLLPYKVVRSFALELRPIEMNIIQRREGNELWLYDTTVSAQPPAAPDRYLAFYYFYQRAFFKLRTMVGLKSLSAVVWKTLKKKL